MRKLFLAALIFCLVGISTAPSADAWPFHFGMFARGNTTSRAWTPPVRVDRNVERAAHRIARHHTAHHVAIARSPRGHNRVTLVHGFMGNAESPLLARALRDVGRNPTGWSHQWCGRQMALWVGHGPNLASAWARIGRPSSARPGAIAVMPHHVGVVKEVSGSSVILVAGNHAGRSGHRVVGVGLYPISRIIAFRSP